MYGEMKIVHEIVKICRIVGDSKLNWELEVKCTFLVNKGNFFTGKDCRQKEKKLRKAWLQKESFHFGFKCLGAVLFCSEVLSQFEDLKCFCSASSAARARQPPPQDVILFVIGGGNYVEYQNLVDYGKLKNLQRVTYGCTELVNPRQFTDQVCGWIFWRLWVSEWSLIASVPLHCDVCVIAAVSCWWNTIRPGVGLPVEITFCVWHKVFNQAFKRSIDQKVAKLGPLSICMFSLGRKNSAVTYPFPLVLIQSAIQYNYPSTSSIFCANLVHPREMTLIVVNEDAGS